MRINDLAVTACVLILLVCSGVSRGQAARLQLKIAGDTQVGYIVNIYEGDHLRVTRREEFCLELFNLDLSTKATISWKGASWSGNDSLITLKRKQYVPAFDADLEVEVCYAVVHAGIVKKTIRLFQPSMPGMYYILHETNRPPETPLQYSSFEEEHFPGGFVHEMYPAVGWVTPDHQLVGFLTDAGYLNQYSRSTRRRFSGRGGGFTGLRRLPDPKLFAVSTPDEQKAGDGYIRLTYGEMFNLDAGSTAIEPIPGEFQFLGQTTMQKTDSLLSIRFPAGKATGVSVITPIHDQQVYTISFEAKGSVPLAVKLYRMKNGVRSLELEDGLKYVDAFPLADSVWAFFSRSIFVPYISHEPVQLMLGSESGLAGNILVRNLKITAQEPASEPYNILPLGEPVEKTGYVFIEPWKSQKDFMIAAQTRLAEGKGFEGSRIEKMMYGNFNMLTWITSVQDFTPFNVPNMNYMPDMYNRDCFFAAVSSYNKELNISLWNQWAKTQTSRGAIGTIITPYMGSVEAKDNEASIEWLMWALLNQRRFGYKAPANQIKRTVDYILNEFDSTGQGICYSHFPLCQVDIIDFNPKTDRQAVNQGMLAIALRVIKELGYPVTEEHVVTAEQAYRNFYDVKRQHLLYDKKFPDLISVTDLEPEFYSYWLFNKPILTDDMVQHHLSQIPILNQVPNAPHPELGTTAPVLIRLTNDQKGWAYLSKDYQPFEKFGEENYSDGKNDGFYYNGGSWLRAEYCAYVVGLKHGWAKARPVMENRVWAEINLNPAWPFSKEFIPTKWTSTDSWWPSTKGLCWNVFILMADEVAGLRSPDMDPDYRKSKSQHTIALIPIVHSQN